MDRCRRPTWGWSLVLLCSGVIIGGGLVACLGSRDLPTSGSAAEWVGALGTVAAFAAALWLLQHERAARRADDRERRRSQAECVFFDRHEADPAEDLIPVDVANYSDKPVRRVQIYRWLNEDHHASWGPEELGTLGPSTACNVPVMIVPERDVGLIAMAVVFEDAGGRRWRRWEGGTLEELQQGDDGAEARREAVHQRVVPTEAEQRSLRWNREDRRLGPTG